jgi:hypothetical protein
MVQMLPGTVGNSIERRSSRRTITIHKKVTAILSILEIMATNPVAGKVNELSKRSPEARSE